MTRAQKRCLAPISRGGVPNRDIPAPIPQIPLKVPGTNFRPRERGFTLLEVLVATVIMAIAVTTMLSSLSGSMRNAARLTDYDQATLLGRQKLDELLVTKRLPRFQVFQGPFDGVQNAGWRARVTPWETVPNPAPGFFVLDRIELEVWWTSGDRRKTFSLEGFRRNVLTQEDIAQGIGAIAGGGPRP